jgi:hypothetical protein
MEHGRPFNTIKLRSGFRLPLLSDLFHWPHADSIPDTGRRRRPANLAFFLGPTMSYPMLDHDTSPQGLSVSYRCHCALAWAYPHQYQTARPHFLSISAVFSAPWSTPFFVRSQTEHPVVSCEGQTFYLTRYFLGQRNPYSTWNRHLFDLGTQFVARHATRPPLLG